MLKQLLEIKLFEGIFQSENLDNPNFVLYLKMKVIECYGRVEAGELSLTHSYRANDLTCFFSFI